MKKVNSISLNEYYPSYALNGVGKGSMWLHICRLHHNFVCCVVLVLAFLVFSVFWMQRGIEGFFLCFVLGFCCVFFDSCYRTRLRCSLQRISICTSPM